MKTDAAGDVVSNKLVVYLRLGFRELCVITVSLPLAALFVCFVTAYVFQPDEIHETHCRVYNIIPSISAITGVSPQRYLWRICVALHIGPRIIIAFVYRTYYRTLVDQQQEPVIKEKGAWLANICFWLNMIEVAALCGVTYISNRENYPVHEKIFILFMMVSLCYMLATIQLRDVVGPHSPQQVTSQMLKKSLFYLSIVSTVGLVLFFLKHRLLCHDMAFSWFALCEYIIASANMAFHFTIIWDFPSEQILVAREDTSDSVPSIKNKND